MTDEQTEIDVAELDAMFSRIPSGPYSADARGESWEVRVDRPDPTNRHNWPYRLCESVRGQKAGCDPDVFGFIAGVINAWPSIRETLSASSVGEDISTDKHTAEDWKSLAMENERSVQHWIAKFDALSARLADAVQPLSESEAERTKIVAVIRNIATRFEPGSASQNNHRALADAIESGQAFAEGNPQ